MNERQKHGETIQRWVIHQTIIDRIAMLKDVLTEEDLTYKARIEELLWVDKMLLNNKRS